MRITTTKRVLTVATATALLSGIGAAAFAVDDAKEVRQADFDSSAFASQSATSNGSLEFLEEGVHITTDNGKVARYFNPKTTDLPTEASQDWYGTDTAPGMQIAFDVDGDRSNTNNFNMIVGESVYGDDWWYTGGQTRATARGFTCPETSGGFGSDCHGTLAQWSSTLPELEVLSYGFSLGSGATGDGVLRSQTYGDDEYIFTDEAGTPAPVTAEAHSQSNPVTGTGSWSNANRVARFTMDSASVPVNDTGRGTKVRWAILVNGVQRYSSTNGWDDLSTWTWTFGKEGGSQKVEVKRNGVSYSTRYITTR